MVQNSADENQVKERGRREKRERERELDDIRAVIALPEGRRFIARLLTQFKIAGSIWMPSAEIHRNAGHQEAGQFILGEIVRADKALGAQMLADAYEKELGESTDV